MALITPISLFVVSVLTAALSRIVAEEIGEWIPSIIRGFIKLAVAWLPDTQRERFGEEWQSHVNEVPGGLGKLAFAAGLLIAARKMALSARHDQSVDQGLQRLALMDDVLSKAAAVSTAIHSDTELASREELSAHLGQLDAHLGRLNLLRAKLATGVAKAAARPRVHMLTLLYRGFDGVTPAGFDRMSQLREEITERYALCMKALGEREKELKS